MEGMWLMLQQPSPDDFVLATGETHKVREFVNKSFDAVGIQLKYAPPPINFSYHSNSLIFLSPDGKGVVKKNTRLTSVMVKLSSESTLPISDRPKWSAYFKFVALW